MIAARTIHRSRRLGAGGGFTLIELVAVLVILTVLSGVSVATLTSLQDTRSAMAARRLVHDLTFARQRSLATGTRTWVVVDATGQSWTLLAENPDHPGRSGATALTDPATGRPRTVTLNSDRFVGVTFQTVDLDGDDEIGFDWLGQPLSAAETALTAQGAITLSAGHAITIAVGSGHVTYVDP